MARAPIACTGSLSKMGTKVLPRSRDFHTPPDALPRYQVRASPGTPTTAETRPPAGGPIISKRNGRGRGRGRARCRARPVPRQLRRGGSSQRGDDEQTQSARVLRTPCHGCVKVRRSESVGHGSDRQCGTRAQPDQARARPHAKCARIQLPAVNWLLRNSRRIVYPWRRILYPICASRRTAVRTLWGAMQSRPRGVALARDARLVRVTSDPSPARTVPHRPTPSHRAL